MDSSRCTWVVRDKLERCCSPPLQETWGAPFCLHLDKPRPASWVIGQGWSLIDVMFTARPASGPLGTKPAANLGTRWFGQAGPSFCSAGTNDDCSLLKATTFGGALFNSDARQRDTERAWGLPCLQC
ncbi:unnamed protein product [Rangifer tarandus platyrhynchus]|uniref:Uncharacterized protein n=1 Tax=Rangifer tarandus platyrhynchus TaxID=3082113 RepID=A0AC59YQ58_RANTA